MRLKEGQVFAGYTVVRKLGRGGMASIYLVSEPDFARQVALKVLPEDLADEPSFVARFQQEAQTIATLEHPSIVPLYRFGIEDGVPWMALRYVAGGDLARRMAERPLGLAEGFALLGDIAKALDHAHRRGVIHRDLKPQNILLDEEGHAYLADFGVAKLLEATALVRTGTGSAVGTPTYMSPEQALGHELTGASDIYALGVICYQWWTGVLPFDADTPHAVLLKHAMEPLPTKPLEPLSPAVAAVLTRSLDKNPKARYATATALIEALREAQSSAPGTAPPVARQAPPPIPDAVDEPVAMGPAAREAPTSPPAPPHSGAITPPPASTPRPAVQITRPPARAGAAQAASSSALWWWLGGLGGLLVLIVVGVLVWAVMQTAAPPAVPGDYEGFVAGRAVRVSLHDDGGGVVRADGQADEPVSWSISNADPGHVRVPMGDDSAPLRLPVDALLSGRYLAPTDAEHGLMLVRRSTPDGAPWPQVALLPAGWREGKVSFACDEGQAGNGGWLRLRDDGQAKVRIGDDVHMAMWAADAAADGSAVVRLSGETLGATVTETRWEAPEAFAAGACASGAIRVE